VFEEKPSLLAQAFITFSMDADLRSAFSWNTKQLFVYLQVSVTCLQDYLLPHCITALLCGVDNLVLKDMVVFFLCAA
jgi:hypothetical protein